MWLTSLFGVPLIVVAVDILTNRRIVAALQAIVFPNGEPQEIELRDELWAGWFGVVGLLFTLWGLWGLLRSKPVLAADPVGISLELGHPLAKPTLIPWEAVVDLGAGAVDDGGSHLRVLWIKVDDPALLPSHPWGARMISDNTLAILATDWEAPPEKVAAQLVDIAMGRVEP